MAGLDRFERIMERVVEGSVGRVFRSQVQPAEIGRRLEQAMEARPLVSVNGTIVPNDYRVHLNPEDAASFQPMQQGLCESFAQWLEVIGGERGYRFMGPISVALMSDPECRTARCAGAGRRTVAHPTAAGVHSPFRPARSAGTTAAATMPPAGTDVAPSCPPGAPERDLDSFTVRQRPPT